jgi:hypothetical protein
MAAALAFTQQIPPTDSTSSSDPLKGVWKLNVDKSKNATVVPDSEVITIISQNGGYKLTFDTKQSNGYNSKYDIVTIMKGETIKPVNADGSGTNDSWRVSRQSSNEFDMELMSPFGGWTDKYEVSPNGKTMTLHRVLSNTGLIGGRIDNNGNVAPEHPYILVFERVK